MSDICIPKEVVFDEAIYDPGINWCWFHIRSGKTVAIFRLHMDETECWDMFKLLDGQNLFPHTNASMTFRYGRDEHRNGIAVKPEKTNSVPIDFIWLENHQFYSYAIYKN
jgi:hypothetical protein